MIRYFLTVLFIMGCTIDSKTENTVPTIPIPDIIAVHEVNLKPGINSIEFEKVPEYSMFKVMIEMRKPEMKKALGFMMTFMKNISNIMK